MRKNIKELNFDNLKNKIKDWYFYLKKMITGWLRKMKDKIKK